MVVRHADSDAVASGPEHWPINWSAIWVGTLAALAVALIVSLIGAALGAHQLGPAGRIASWKDIGFGALVFAVIGSFFSFVVGGWVAGKVNGFHRAETDMLHGAVVWLVAVPSLVALAALGAGSFFGGWYGSLVGVPVWATPNTAAADPAAATAARAPLLTVTALLTGLVGSVLGGWLASGEAASIYLYRTRTRAQRPQSVRQPA